MDFLKDALGEELYSQVAEKLKDNKEIKLANLAKGEYVGKDKFEAQAEQMKQMKSQVEEANKQIESFKSMNIDEIKKTADEYKTKFETAEAEHKRQLEETQFGFALKESLTAAKAKNAKAVEALLDKNSLKFTEGKIIGLDEQLKTIREQNDYLFSADSAEKQPEFSKGTGGGKAPELDTMRAAMGLPPAK